ncbi:MAG: hypothetical protein R3335_09880, partial [Anaerolineales bacterium]|nr:hypothetical protein [Anaerolineales bacterium]
MPSIQLPGPALPGPISSSVRERWAFWLIIALGLVHGLIYVFLVPPWQHSDEPSHFEHAWLIAANRRLPVSGEFDPEMRRAVFDSMAAHQFFVGIGYDPSPDAFWASARSQVSEPPAYYLLAAGPLAAIPLDSVDGQLRLVRILSLGLYIATIGAAYGILRSLTRPGHWLRLMVPFSMAALPGLANLMTSVNNDVLAVAALSFFIWPAGLLIVEGFSWRRAVAAGALALLCAGAKSTALVAVPLLAVALLFSLLRGPRRRLAWGALAAAGLLGLGLAAGWGDAA